MNKVHEMIGQEKMRLMVNMNDMRSFDGELARKCASGGRAW